MTRKEHRQAWLTAHLGHDQFSLIAASADASFRSYYRVTIDQQSYILMDAPPEHEDCEPFINIQKLLAAHQINVPVIHAADSDHGFLLLSDFGQILYLDQLDDTTADQLYQPAIQTLVNLQRIKPPAELPPYDQALLMNEMGLFETWFIGEHLGHELTTKQHKVMRQAFDFLAAQALQQPQVLVHRDYHSRNLMVTDVDSPGVIDFQDAVYGPLTYDLASLLKDCYITWPATAVDQWCAYYLSLHNQHQDTPLAFEQFKTWFDLMAAQRHLKAIGIFCRLNYRDGKKGYLNDIPRTLNYLLDTCQQYPQLHAMAELLDQVQPTLQARG